MNEKNKEEKQKIQQAENTKKSVWGQLLLNIEVLKEMNLERGKF